MWFKNKKTGIEFFITNEEHLKLIQKDTEFIKLVIKEEAPKKKGAGNGNTRKNKE